jgi:putrescine aminotransferase
MAVHERAGISRVRAAESPTATEEAREPVLEVIRRHLSPGLALGYRMLARGACEASASGASVRLSDGRELVDFGSYAVTLLGHRCPRVVDAVVAQIETMPTATRVLANPVVAAMADALQERCGPGLDRVWLGCGGAEAVEVAAKLARRVTGRTRVVAVEGGFHGKTLGALAMTRAPLFRTGLEPLLGHVVHVPPDDPEAVARATAAGDIAALVIEPVRGEGGVRPLDDAVAARWADDARAAGAFVVSDEIQTGLRRCGDFSLAVARGWRPDAVVFGKALGGGVMPLSAVVATASLHEPLYRDPAWHTATFGGHPASCAAGLAALAAIDEHAEHGARVGRAVAAGLAEIAAAYPEVVAAVRCAGLMFGLDLRSPATAGEVFTGLAENGLLVSPCLASPCTIRLLPPMVTTDGEIGRALDALDSACAAARKHAESRS